MSLTETIRHPANLALGTVEDVMQSISDAFPGVHWVLVETEPRPEVKLPALLKLWLALFGQRVRYPHYSGAFENHSAVVEFYVELNEPVRWIRSTSYGMTDNLEEHFARLSSATGWIVAYPRS